MTQAALAQILLDALDDERKAEATYGAVIEKFGPVRPFIRIIEAERRHAAALERQMLRLGIPIPANTWSGKDVAPDSLAKACEEAITAEIENIALYDRLLPSVEDPQVLRVLTNLQAASRDRHLPAFRRCLERGPGSAGPESMGPAGGPRQGPGRRTHTARGRSCH